jgi:pimeloyl-ACP methyl ester carboxylesterase
MPAGKRNGFLALLFVLALTSPSTLVGCARGPAKTPLRLTRISPSLPLLARKAVTPEPPLIVITYGNGCTATGPGNGLRDLAELIRRDYPNLRVITRGCNDRDDIAETVEDHPGPVVLIGHSFGGCRSIELAAQLRRPVDSLILLDPVPCEDWAFRHADRYFQIPASIKSAICFYHPHCWPVSYPMLNPPSPDGNRMRYIGHSAFCRDSEIWKCVLDVCEETETRQNPPRVPVVLAAGRRKALGTDVAGAHRRRGGGVAGAETKKV